ncbi:MFS transporter [Luteimonas suaedae]|uniref:MFS transporter n=1 Tax=Luteimonas suaedae TaxID=2605430 RepID=UPI0029393572|nr:MFS transporter [Luteimonas suaedae]
MSASQEAADGRRPASDRTAKLAFSEKIGFGLGDAGFNFYWVIIGSYLLYFYTDIFGISASAAAWMFAATRVIDAFTDPAIGALADRTRSRWGKFRPYILFGALPLMGSAILTMSTPDLGETGKLIWVYATYSAMMLCYTIVNIPYNSLAGVLTADGRERSTVFGIRFFFAYLTGIIVGAATPDLAAWFGGDDAARGWQLTMVLYSAVATALFLVTFLTTRERVTPPRAQKTHPLTDIADLLKNRPWVILFALAMIVMITIVLRGSSAAYYFKYFVERPDLMGAYIGLQMAAYAVGAIATPFLTRRFDKARLLMVTMAIVGTLSILYAFVPAPASNGVVTITGNAAVTLQADAMLDAPAQADDHYRWTRHENAFWIVRKRVELEETGPVLTLANAQGQVISVTRTGTDGTRVDSADLPAEIVVMFLLNILISLALGPKSPLTWSMYADAADYNEWKTGRRATGMTFSAATFSQKLGGALGAAGVGWVLAAMGYAANQAQSGASQTGIVLLQTAVPGVFALIAMFALRFYDLSGAKLEQIQRDLEARERAGD